MTADEAISGLQRFYYAELDSNSPPVCEACRCEYTMDFDHEATAFCDGCAHEAVEALAQEVKRLRDETLRMQHATIAGLTKTMTLMSEKLARAEALPAKWREHERFNAPASAYRCADELEEALRGEP